MTERKGKPADPAFPTIFGTQMSHDALQYLLDKHFAVACHQCPSLADKRVTPHVLRHTLAMNLLHHGVDRSVIALWLGHESVETTAMYLQADMQLKEQALAKTDTADVRASRYKPDDRLLAFLKSL
jgi:site-specific recombinase XerD